MLYLYLSSHHFILPSPCRVIPNVSSCTTQRSAVHFCSISALWPLERRTSMRTSGVMASATGWKQQGVTGASTSLWFGFKEQLVTRQWVKIQSLVNWNSMSSLSAQWGPVWLEILLIISPTIRKEATWVQCWQSVSISANDVYYLESHSRTLNSSSSSNMSKPKKEKSVSNVEMTYDNKYNNEQCRADREEQPNLSLARS